MGFSYAVNLITDGADAGAFYVQQKTADPLPRKPPLPRGERGCLVGLAHSRFLGQARYQAEGKEEVMRLREEIVYATIGCSLGLWMVDGVRLVLGCAVRPWLSLMLLPIFVVITIAVRRWMARPSQERRHRTL
jgi:hypothetical protein